MMDGDWTVKVGHIYREANWPTDYFVGLGHSLPLGVHYDISDLKLFLHTLYDLLEVFLPRLIVTER
ncbi:hypothetical protein LINPERPRIM_LOCUS26169 [Linum perenne]